MQTLLKTTQAYSLLQTEGKERRFGHAYLLLFNDPKNIRLALKTFAKLFFDCAETENEGGMYASNDKKRIAELIDNDSFSDCLFFPSQDKKLTVEDAERIQEECTLNPVEGNRKVFLLADFAEANVQTQNKLLKMLEEPPEGVIFLLGATTVFPVLPTVLSRTKKLEIQPFEIAEVTECLTRIYGDKYDRETLALCTPLRSVTLSVTVWCKRSFWLMINTSAKPSRFARRRRAEALAKRKTPSKADII